MAFSVCSRMLTEILDYIRNDTQSYNYEHLKIGLYADALTKVLIVIVEVV